VKVLRIGDPHVKHSNLEESDRLFGFALDTAVAEKVDRIDILGDLFHNHVLVRLDVMDFWRKWAVKFAEAFPTYMLVGNHDMPGDRQSEWKISSLDSLPEHPNLTIVKTALIGDDGIAYMSYTHSPEKFLMTAKEMSTYPKRPRTLVCHGTFVGSKYDNDYPAPDGIDPDLVPFDFVVSGHIHGEQEFGKVHHPGTPRWDGSSDANKRKGLWVYEHAQDGAVLSKKMIGTESVCTPVVDLEWKEGQEMPKAPPNARATYSIVGTSAWVRQAKKSALESGALARTTFTDSVASKALRKSAKGLEDYLDNVFQPSAGVAKKEILEWLSSP